MKFHSIVLPADGRISDRQEIDSADLFSNKTSRRVVRKFSDLLRDKLSGNPFDPPPFTVLVDKPQDRCILDWRQGEPTSAMATFIIDEKPVLLSIFFTGRVPEFDGIVVRVTRATLASLFEETDDDPGPGLDEIPERPVVINIPCLAGLPAHDIELLFRASHCLALAFFLHVETFFETLTATLRRQTAHFQGMSRKLGSN